MLPKTNPLIKNVTFKGNVDGGFSSLTSLSTSCSSRYGVTAVRNTLVCSSRMIITAAYKVGSTANTEKHVFIITIIRSHTQHGIKTNVLLLSVFYFFLPPLCCLPCLVTFSHSSSHDCCNKKLAARFSFFSQAK